MAPQFRSLSAALVVGSSLLAARLTAVDGFSTKTQVTPCRSDVGLQMASGNSLLDRLPKFPFSAEQEDDSSPVATVMQTLSSEFKATPDGLVTRAKVVLASDLGIQDESLLDGNFIWIGPNLGSSVLDKRDYIAAGKFFNLRCVSLQCDVRVWAFDMCGSSGSHALRVLYAALQSFISGFGLSSSRLSHR